MWGRAFTVLAVLSLIAGMTIYVAFPHHTTNFFGYLFNRGPYINRVFFSKTEYMIPGKPLFHKIIKSPDFDDRRWGSAQFDIPARQRVTVPANQSQIATYEDFVHDFLGNFEKLKNEKPEPSPQFLANFIHKYWLANNDKPGFDQTPFNVLPEKDRHPEDLVFFFANYSSGCGTVAETTVALLRHLGFRTRLMFMSQTDKELVANHVFVEYFSRKFNKWVMLDSMEGFVPTHDGVPMSAFEFYAAPNASDQHLKGERYSYVNSAKMIGFTKMGPIMTGYRMKTR